MKTSYELLATTNFQFAHDCSRKGSTTVWANHRCRNNLFPTFFTGYKSHSFLRKAVYFQYSSTRSARRRYINVFQLNVSSDSSRQSRNDLPIFIFGKGTHRLSADTSLRTDHEREFSDCLVSGLCLNTNFVSFSRR